MASSCCNITAAMAASIFLLAPPCSGRGSKDGRGCAVVSRSKTFTGACENDENDCYDACVGEGYTDGYCFLDVDTPDHFVCMCASHCPPPPSSTTRRKTTS
ncbi:hypothetical protein ABZP36_033234 [Zizania latifolia]